MGIVPTIDDSPTIMIDQNELTQRIQTNDDTQPVEDSDSNASGRDDEEEETGMNSKIEKLVIVLAAVVGAIILILCVFVVKKFWIIQIRKINNTKYDRSNNRSQTSQYYRKNTQLIIISDCL